MLMKKFVVISLLFCALLAHAMPTSEIFLHNLIRAGRSGVLGMLPLEKQFNGYDFDILKQLFPGKYSALFFVKDRTPVDAKILTFRKNDLLAFSDRRCISPEDTSLLGVYKAGTVAQCYAQLRDLGVDYIYSPTYQVPMVVNTQVTRLLADPKYSTLEYASRGARVFKLRERVTSNMPALRLGDIEVDLTSAMCINTSGKLLSARRDADGDGRPYVELSSAGMLSALYTGPGVLDLAPSRCFSSSPIKPATVYSMKSDVRGFGKLRIYLMFYDARGDYITTSLLADLVLDSQAAGGKSLYAQFITPAGAEQYRCVFVLPSEGWLHVYKSSLEEVSRGGGDTSPNGLYVTTALPDSEDLPLFQRPLQLFLQDGFQTVLGATAEPRGQSGSWLWKGDADVVIHTYPGDVMVMPEAEDAYKVEAKVQGQGVFKMLLYSYPRRTGSIRSVPVETSLGYYYSSDSQERMLVRNLDVAPESGAFRVALRPATASELGGYWDVEGMLGDLVVSDLRVFKNDQPVHRLEKPEGHAWSQVYP